MDIIQKVLSENNLKVLLRRPMFVLMNAPVDTNKSLLKGIWRREIGNTVQRGEISALIACNILYPIELFLVSVIKESPSTEIMICKSANSMSD